MKSNQCTIATHRLQPLFRVHGWSLKAAFVLTWIYIYIYIGTQIYLQGRYYTPGNPTDRTLQGAYAFAITSWVSLYSGPVKLILSPLQFFFLVVSFVSSRSVPCSILSNPEKTLANSEPAPWDRPFLHVLVRRSPSLVWLAQAMLGNAHQRVACDWWGLGFLPPGKDIQGRMSPGYLRVEMVKCQVSQPNNSVWQWKFHCF